MKNVLLVGLVFSIIFILTAPVATAQWADSGFNENYTVRQNITVANNDASKQLTTGYTSDFSFNMTASFNQDTIRDDAEDAVIVFQGTEIDSFFVPQSAARFTQEDGDFYDLGDAVTDSVPVGTIEFWFNILNFTNDVTFLDKDALGNNVGDFFIRYSNTTGLITFSLQTTGVEANATTSSAIVLGQWHHLTAQWNTSGNFIYLDGVLEGSNGGVTVGIGNGAENLFIGFDGASGPKFDGFIDELRFSDIVRNSGDFTPTRIPFNNDSNTLGLYHMDDSLESSSGLGPDLAVEGKPHFAEGHLFPAADGTATVQFSLQANLSASTSDTTSYKMYQNNSAPPSPMRNRTSIFSFFEDFEGLTEGDLNGQNGWYGSDQADVFRGLNSYEGTQTVKLFDVGDYQINRNIPQNLDYRFEFFLKKDAPATQGGQIRFELFEGLTRITRVCMDCAVGDPENIILTSSGNVRIAPLNSAWLRFVLDISSDGKMNITTYNTTNGTAISTFNDLDVENSMTNGINNVSIFFNNQAGVHDEEFGDFFKFHDFILNAQVLTSAGEESIEGTPGDPPPTFSDDQTDGTTAGTTVLHSLLWADDAGLDSYVFSFDNGGGTFVNDSAVSFGASPTDEWSNVSKSVPGTIGLTIRWQVFANDTGGNDVASTIFQYTSTGVGDPVITIFSPTNTTFNNVPIDLNVGADQVIDVWKFSLDGGANITFTPNTTFSPTNGFHQITVFGNNTLGEEGSATTFFTVDLLNSVTIVSPTATTFTTVPINLNVITDGTALNFTYSIDGLANVTFTPNTTFLVAEGIHTIEVFATNSAGTQVIDSVIFTFDPANTSGATFVILTIAILVGFVLFVIVITLAFVDKGLDSTTMISLFIIALVGLIFASVATGLIS